MIQGLPKLGAGALSQTDPHDEFLELCAASTSGDLTDDEQRRLREHLAVCASCREALRQYESIVSDVIPAIAASEEPGHVQPAEAWSQEQQGQAEKALFDRLAQRREPSTRRNRKKEWLVDLPPSHPAIRNRVHLAACLDALCGGHSAFLRAQFLRLSHGHASRN